MILRGAIRQPQNESNCYKENKTKSTSLNFQQYLEKIVLRYSKQLSNQLTQLIAPARIKFNIRMGLVFCIMMFAQACPDTTLIEQYNTIRRRK